MASPEIKEAPHCRNFPPARNVFYSTEMQQANSNGTEKVLSADQSAQKARKINVFILILLAFTVLACGCYGILGHFASLVPTMSLFI